MKTIKLTIAYDGSAFHGWQIQPGVPTIQQALVDAARKITQEKIMLHGASRTNAASTRTGRWRISGRTRRYRPWSFSVR